MFAAKQCDVEISWREVGAIHVLNMTPVDEPLVGIFIAKSVTNTAHQFKPTYMYSTFGSS